VFDIHFVIIYFFFYFSIHIVWWRHFRQKGIGAYEIRLANWVDLASGGISVMMDPYSIPPTLMLILIIVLGNGIQHGLKNFIVTSKNAVITCSISIPLHFYLSGQWPPYGLYFCIVFIFICVHYAYYLQQRIENLKTQAENLSQLDELTGVMNRRAFIKSAEYLLSLRARNQIPLVFVFADLDGFKNVNDKHGHAAGDLVLKTLSMMAIQNLRKTDIVARYGGDEFVFILTNSDLENAMMVMDRLEAQFINWAGIHNIGVGLSFGIKDLTESEKKLDEIMHAADERLYQAKRKKRLQQT
jgi:diguanylate cyclase (GGDEF)-like protein